MHLPDDPAAYRLIDLSSGRFYVGSTRNLRKRMSQHRTMMRNGSHYNALLNNRQLDEFQLEYSPHPTVESARKHEDSLLTFHADDDDMSNVATSAYSPWSSGKVPETHKERLSQALDLARSLCNTPEALRKRSESLKGRTFTEETKDKMSDSAKARGSNFSQEGIAKGRAKRSQPIIVDGITYESSRAAGRAHGVCEHTAKNRANCKNFENWSFGPKDFKS